MANIAKLAIKLVADMEKAQKDFTAMSSTISTIQKSAQSATPSMKNLTDAVKGLEIMEGAAQKAVEIQDIASIAHAQNACEELKSTVQRMGEGVGDDILKMNTSIKNVQKAQGEVERLIALQKSMGENGYMLNDSIKKAQASMAELGNRTMQSNAEAQMLQTTLNGINMMPFMILGTVFADLLKDAKEWGATFNTSTLRAVAVTGGLVIVLGLASAKMSALGISASYFTALWKSSMVYQGLAGVITLLNTILGTQIAINAATLAWVGMATLGIGLLVATIASLVMSWYDNTSAIRESEESMKALEASTQKTIDRWKELNGAAKSALESLMTPAEKLVRKLNELDLSQNTDALKTQMKSINERQQHLAAWMADKKNHGWFADTEIYKQLQAEFNHNQEQFAKLREALKGMTTLTEEQLAAAKANAKLEYQKERYGKLLETTLTAQEHYTQTLNDLAEDLIRSKETGIGVGSAEIIRENLNKQLRDQLGFSESPLQKQLDLLKFALDNSVISQMEYSEKVRETMEKYDPATLAAAELAKESQKLADKFRGISKTPLETFKELSVDLRNVQEMLNPMEFAAAKEKLLSDLASGLGVAQYWKDIATPAQQLAETYKNLEAYAREANLSMQELTNAKNRAKEALEKQSKYYSLYQKAQDALLTTQEKLSRELTRIAEEARQWGWDKNIVEKMEELVRLELFGNEQSKLLEEAKKSNKHLDGIEQGINLKERNVAVEYGTVAYYTQAQGMKPLVAEGKKQTQYLGEISKNTQPRRTVTAPYVVIR